MKKLFFILLFIFFTQKVYAQSNTLYLLFDTENLHCLKGIDTPVRNSDGTLRTENSYEYRNNSAVDIKGFYERLYITINKNDFIIIPLSELNNYPVKTINQVRAESHPSNSYEFENHQYFNAIEHYYIVEKNINAGIAKITKVFVEVME